MNQLNSIILEGNVTCPTNVRQTPSGFKVCQIPLAVNRYYKNRNGQFVKEVSYFNVETFGRMADVTEQNADVGRGMRIVGRLKQARWKNSEGKNMSRISIIAEHVEFKPRAKKTDEPNGAAGDFAKKTRLAEDEAPIVAHIAENEEYQIDESLAEDEIMF